MYSYSLTLDYDFWSGQPPPRDQPHLSLKHTTPLLPVDGRPWHYSPCRIILNGGAAQPTMSVVWCATACAAAPALTMLVLVWVWPTDALLEAL